MAALEASRFVVMFAAPDLGQVEDITSDLALLLGYEPEEVVGRSGWDFARETPGERERIEEALVTVGVAAGFVTLVHRNGTPLLFSFRIQRLHGGQWVSILSPAVEVDGRVREAELVARHQELRDLISEALTRTLGPTRDRWLTLSEAMDYTGWSDDTLRRRVPSFGESRDRRWLQSDLDAALRGRRWHDV